MTFKAIYPAVLALTLGATGVALAQTTTTSPSTTTTAPSVTTPSVTTPTTPGATGSAMPGTTATGRGANAPAVSGTHSATNNAVNTRAHNNAGAPVSGANSFTAGQARDRIQAKGFSQVTDLKLDNKGVWRGKGTRNGQSVDVSMDYQGNVTPQ